MICPSLFGENAYYNIEAIGKDCRSYILNMQNMLKLCLNSNGCSNITVAKPEHHLLLTWISNYIHFKVWDKITYPFPNFNGYTAEVWEWISNSIPHFTGHVTTYPCWA